MEGVGTACGQNKIHGLNINHKGSNNLKILQLENAHEGFGGGVEPRVGKITFMGLETNHKGEVNKHTISSLQST